MIVTKRTAVDKSELIFDTIMPLLEKAPKNPSANIFKFLILKV